MKNITCCILFITLFIVTATQYSFAQKPKNSVHKKHITTKPTIKDSIALSNIVTFDKSPYTVVKNKPKYVNIVKFALRITNNSKSAGIPDPESKNYSKYVMFYINGQLNNPKVLYDDVHDADDEDNFIDAGTSQTFYCDWLSTTLASIQKKYGTKYIVQWSYLNIMSKKVAVDAVKKTARIIN
jgi:hypothetical protein